MIIQSMMLLPSIWTSSGGLTTCQGSIWLARACSIASHSSVSLSGGTCFDFHEFVIKRQTRISCRKEFGTLISRGWSFPGIKQLHRHTTEEAALKRRSHVSTFQQDKVPTCISIWFVRSCRKLHLQDGSWPTSPLNPRRFRKLRHVVLTFHFAIYLICYMFLRYFFLEDKEIGFHVLFFIPWIYFLSCVLKAIPKLILTTKTIIVPLIRLYAFFDKVKGRFFFITILDLDFFFL